MPKRNTSTWKKDESEIAGLLNTALDSERLYKHKITRIPLSGSNNRRTNGEAHRGDVSLPDCMNFLVECKRRASFAFMGLFEAAKKDAAKHKLNVNHTILITKALRQRGFCAVISSEFLAELLSIPEVQELLKK
jgi:hypothetical protein